MRNNYKDGVDPKASQLILEMAQNVCSTMYTHLWQVELIVVL